MATIKSTPAKKKKSSSPAKKKASKRSAAPKPGSLIPSVFFRVPSIKAMLARVVATGGTILMDRKKVGKSALGIFRDRKGVCIGLIEL